MGDWTDRDSAVCWIGLKWHRTGYSMAPVWFVLAFLALVFVFAEISALDEQTF